MSCRISPSGIPGARQRRRALHLISQTAHRLAAILPCDRGDSHHRPPSRSRNPGRAFHFDPIGSSTTESAIALLPIVLLPILALGGGVRAAYKMPTPARWISTLVPSRWAFERNVVSEARAHNCGYPPGAEMWDACPTGGKGVDAATMVVPEAETGPADIREPAPLSTGASSNGSGNSGNANTSGGSGRNLRYSFTQTIAALGAMLVALLGAVLVSLKSRDVH